MPDTESGYYSPNETIQYLPHRERGGGGIAKAILRSALQDVKSFFTEMRRYASDSLDRDFLMSSASRRDLWRFILPLPGILAMLSDTDKYDLLLLDAGLSVCLFIMASLPIGWLLSDIVICMIYAAYLPVHSVMCLVPAKLSAASPIMAAFTMASAGINAGVLISFVTLSAIAAPYVAYTWTVEQIWACGYVVFMAVVVERRSTLLVGVGRERHTSEVSYKALGLAGGEDASRIPAEILSGRRTAEALSHAAAGSDGEDASGPLPIDGSAGSFLDQLLHRVNGHGHETQATGPLTSIFSRLGAPMSVSSRSTESRQRFAAEQVSLPGAAAHEAPLFEKGMPDIEQPDPSSPSPPRPMSPSGSQPGGNVSPSGFLRGVKLGGFQNQELNVLFVEKTDPRLVVNGRETYWPASAAFFIYRSVGTKTWGVGKAKRFQQIKENKSHGIAHSPESYELWLDVNEIPTTPSNSKKDWREWDAETNKWVHRPGAGVLSRGKVRPKVGLRSTGLEVASQTALTWLKESPVEVEDQAVQANAPETSQLVK